MQNSVSIQARLNFLRRRLIDTSLRNRFLNYRPSRKASLEIFSPSVSEILDALVVQGKNAYAVSPIMDEPAITRGRYSRSATMLVKEEKDRLGQKLLHLWRTTVAFQEEQGINTLYLALGSIEWYEGESSSTRLVAPLIFVPLQIERSSRDVFQFRYEGSEIVHNIVFAEKIKQDFGIELPPFTFSDDLNTNMLEDYFSSVCSSIASNKRWQVDGEFKAISFFNFTKFVIYKDLDLELWMGDEKIISTPANRLLMGESEAEVSQTNLIDEKMLDDLRPVSTSVEVFDADSSQIAAIVQAKHSKVMIIEGPPGTGKSQTIANLIAEAIYEGKRVLFVSEKKAALDVVWQRLQEAGISQACLELHSNKANKKSFYEQIRVALRAEPKSHIDDLKHELDSLTRLREKVNSYYSALHSAMPERGVSPYTCMAELFRLGTGIADGRVSFATMQSWTQNDFLRRKEIIVRLQSHIKRYGLQTQHPLWGNGLEIILPTDFEVITQSIATIYSLLLKVSESSEMKSLKREQLDLLRGLLKNTSADEVERLTEDALIIKQYLSTWFRRLIPKYRAALKHARIVLGNNLTEADLLNFATVSALIWRVDKSLEELLQLLKARGSLLQLTQLSYEDLENYMRQLMNLSYDDLQPLVRYNQIRAEALREQLEPWVIWAEADIRHAEALLLAYEYTWYAGVLQEAFAKYPALYDFAEDAEDIVEQFRQKDRLLLRINRLRVALNHTERLPRYRAAGNLAVLQRELQKSRAHKPIRRIMQEAGDAILTIKPVFMMSPLSVATYLPAGNPMFDLVIFDEASQIKPEDAFSALLRARQAVVVGDTKQLPPTNFFDRLTDEDEENDDDIAVGLDSILDLASATIPEGSPCRRMLRWHYRSKHPSLIVCSNRLFYDNQLIVPPNPETNSKQVGIIFHYIPNTTYDRGRTRKNWEEAQIVAQSVISHLRLYPELSVGVVALSVQQQEAIWDAIELALRNQSDLGMLIEAHNNRHIREPLFVKNLETVQGDERDVIFVSIGYGRDEHGKLSMNFGPINKDGGEKRLNVLFTRARHRCEIFANFRWSDIRVEPTSPKGISALRTFLHYAETGNFDIPVSSQHEPMSPFEVSVIKVLEAEGYNVAPQVGSAGFYIDIGVLHPHKPGKFVLGIECDGARYHSSRTARERDRLRQELLEKHGWRIHRIWSTSWYKNFVRERERLLNAVTQAILDDENNLITSVNENEQNSHFLLDMPAVQQISSSPHSLRADPMIEFPAGEFRRYEMADLSNLASGLRSAFGTNQGAHPVLIAQVVEHIVSVESPIHIEELIRRIREAGHFARAGKNIRTAIIRGIEMAEMRGKVDFDGKFVMKRTSEFVVPRSRRDFPAQYRKVEYIHPDEISQAIIEVVKLSFGISVSEACSEVLKRFGFERVTEPMRSLVRQQVEELLKRGLLHLDGTQLRLIEKPSAPKQV